MSIKFLDLKTDPTLIEKLSSARKPSQEEIFEQRVSFAFASMPQKSSVTREHVRQVIIEHDGGNSRVPM